VKEFSQYDAGWLHFFKSENFGEIRRANWDDLNIPARLATLGLAGLPMLQADNSEHVVATQSFVKKHNLGLFFKDMRELGQLLRDRQLMLELRENVWKQRGMFMFDNNVNSLIDFFEAVIKNRKKEKMHPKSLFSEVG
jgi:hypothetical protein